MAKTNGLLNGVSISGKLQSQSEDEGTINALAKELPIDSLKC